MPQVHALYIERIKGMNYTYILECSDGSLYTGWTNHLEKRLEDHNSGRGAKYTKGRAPVQLAYYEMFGTKKEAMRREWEIKQLCRKDKLRLIRKSGKGGIEVLKIPEIKK